MVRLLVKKGDEAQFLFETSTKAEVDVVRKEILDIFNARLKVKRICEDIQALAEHGIALPPNMQGLTDEQVEDLKLVDEWEDISVPSGGWEDAKDEIGRRNGRRPKPEMVLVLKNTVEEVKGKISKKLCDPGVDKALTLKDVDEALSLLKGAVTIVYPMGLPPHDPIRLEFEGKEDLAGTHDSLDVIVESELALWFCGKEMFPGKKLGDYLGGNEKTKVVVKVGKRGTGPPGREPVLSEAEKKELMMIAYRKQQEDKKLTEDNDDSHLDSEWADTNSLKRSFHGIRDVSWRPR